jgi:hypothetical protein
MAINSIVSTDSITVFGPPEVIELGLDIGAQGQRGSLIYTGSGDPNINTGVFVNDPALVGDLYLRTDFGSNYGVVYQYNTVPSGNEWSSVLKFQPVTYSVIEPVTFVSGSATVSILVNDIYEDAPATLTSSNFSIQLTPEHDKAVSFSIHNKGLVTETTRSLVFTIFATEQDQASGVVNLVGEVDFNITINVLI